MLDYIFYKIAKPSKRLILDFAGFRWFNKKLYLPASFAHVSFKPTVLLKTNLSVVESTSKQKYPLRKN
jgi:hypothetical protein